MSQEKIPDNNLPVFLQKYKVSIFDEKSDTKTGSVLYTTVGAIPSNEKEKRVWKLNLTGYLKPDTDKYYIVYDFKDVDYKYKDTITFENIISGTFNICGHVFDASKIIGFNYQYSDSELTLTIIIDTSKLGLRLKKESLFSFDLNLDDSDCLKSIPKIVPRTYKLYLQAKDQNDKVCYTGLCENSNIYCALLKDDKYYYNFSFGKYFYYIVTTNEKDDCTDNTLYLAKVILDEYDKPIIEKYFELVSKNKVLIEEDDKLGKAYAEYNYRDTSFNPCNDITTCPTSLLLGNIKFSVEKKQTLF